jgi:predicted enzyme related to lactoylglutathione lyase
MAIIKLDEFNLPTVYVDDFEKNLAFYMDILGMTKEYDMEPGIVLRATKDCVMYLEGGREPVAVKPSEKTEVSLCFSTVEGLKKSYEALKAAKVTLVGEYMEFAPEFHMFRIADPAGNTIEFAGKP